MVSEACERDDVSMLTEAMAFASSSASRVELADLLHVSLGEAVANNAHNAIRCLLGQGANINRLRPYNIARGGFSRQTIELLLEYDWDINSRDATGVGLDGAKPFLWIVVTADRDDLVP